jgi:hypothetical protein
LALLLVAPHWAHAACTAEQLKPGWLWSYYGTIGERDRVRLTITLAKGEFSGVYFHAGELKDIRVSGRALDGKRLLLDELDAGGKIAARFEIEFAEHDPRGKFPGTLRCQIIAGSWQKTGSPRKLPVYLSLENGNAGTLAHLYAIAGVKDDGLIHRSALRFQQAVGAGDKVTVAALIEYPIRAHVMGTAKTFHGARELLAQYDAIFTPVYKRAIAEALPRNMFANDRGIMMGSGAAWFSAAGRVVVLNN